METDDLHTNIPEVSPRILVVEDERIVAMDLRRTLIRLGYRVHRVVDSGEDAVEAVKDQLPQNRIHLILMDIGLQGELNGIEAAREIRDMCEIPVIFATAYTDDRTLKDAALSGAFGYIVKPFEEQDLKSTIELALYKHKMEKQLKEERERFQQLFAQNTDAVVLFKKDDFCVTHVNPAAVNLFRFPREQLFNEFSCIFDNLEIFQLFKEEIESTLGRGEAVFFDRCRLKQKDGREIICSIQVNVITLQANDVLYCVFRDITEKTRMEEESRGLQAKLIHTNRMTALGTLASGLAHEINNPNNFIMSNTQMVQQVWDDAARYLKERYESEGDFALGGLLFSEARDLVPRLLKDTVEGTRRIKYITDNLKEFSRPQDSQVFAKITINKLIKFSIDILSNQIKKYTDAFSFEPGEDIPKFKGNPQQIEQVLINLIQNALYALPDKSRGVRVSSGFHRETGQIVVTVADDGVGMNEKILDRITDPFFTTRQDSGGTGLGLYISYSIIRAHRGSIEFQSQSGKGTAATVKIPLSQDSGGGPHE